MRATLAGLAYWKERQQPRREPYRINERHVARVDEINRRVAIARATLSRMPEGAARAKVLGDLDKAIKVMSREPGRAASLVAGSEEWIRRARNAEE